MQVFCYLVVMLWGFWKSPHHPSADAEITQSLHTHHFFLLCKDSGSLHFIGTCQCIHIFKVTSSLLVSPSQIIFTFFLELLCTPSQAALCGSMFSKITTWASFQFRVSNLWPLYKSGGPHYSYHGFGIGLVDGDCICLVSFSNVD